MSEQFSIMIGNRSRFDAGDPGGYWLDMPATKEQLHEAMRNVGITADNPQDFSIRGYSDDPEKHIALPYEMVCAADVDELNFLAARLEQLDPRRGWQAERSFAAEKRACKYWTGN